MPDQERRFLTAYREADSSEAGLVIEDNGTVWWVAAGGARTQLGVGGGGGGLPDWWTVDSTPGSESVEFAGAGTFAPSDAAATPLTAKTALGNGGIAIYAAGGVSSDPQNSNDPGAADAIGQLYAVANVGQGAMLLELDDENYNTVVKATPSGAVTISPSDDTLDHLVEIVAPAGLADNTSGNGDILQLKVGSDILFQFDVYGDLINRSTGTTVVLDQFTADGARVSVGASSFGAYVNGYNGDGTAALWRIGPQAQGGTMLDLPTADPTVAGQLWNDTGTVKVSAG